MCERYFDFLFIFPGEPGFLLKWLTFDTPQYGIPGCHGLGIEDFQPSFFVPMESEESLSTVLCELIKECVLKSVALMLSGLQFVKSKPNIEFHETSTGTMEVSEFKELSF